jgi:hypothetical protein
MSDRRAERRHDAAAHHLFTVPSTWGTACIMSSIQAERLTAPTAKPWAGSVAHTAVGAFDAGCG